METLEKHAKARDGDQEWRETTASKKYSNRDALAEPR